MGRLIDVDKFLERVKKDREHEIYLHSWTADMVLERLDSWYAPTVEAIPKADYENRLKSDVVAMLTEIQLEIAELPVQVVSNVKSIIRMEIEPSAEDAYEVIQEKINALKGEKDGSN